MSQRASNGFGFFQIFAFLERIGISACFQPPIRSGTLRLSDTSPARSSGSKGSAITPAFKSSGRFCAFARLDLFKGRSPAVLSSILGLRGGCSRPPRLPRHEVGSSVEIFPHSVPLKNGRSLLRAWHVRWFAAAVAAVSLTCAVPFVP